MTKEEHKKIMQHYHSKVEEYSKLTLDELKKLFEDSKKSKKTRLGGSNKQAFLDVVTKKLQEQSIKSKIEEIKEDDKKE